MKTLVATLMGVAALAASTAAAAQNFPNRPVHVIVMTSPGGFLDATTRLVARHMSTSLGQPVTVENKPGADGIIGIRAVKAATPDGYTLLSTGSALTQQPALKKDPGYELVKDFVGVGMMAETPLLLVGNPAQAARTLPDLISQAKAAPGSVSISHGGSGRIAGQMLLQQADIKAILVPYKGTGGLMPDLLAGRVNVALDGGSTSGPHLRDGKLRAFGVTSARRSPGFPDVPTFAEQGLPNYNFSIYLGLAAPAGTPKEVVNRLAEALKAALAKDEVREFIRNGGGDPPSTNTPEAFTQFLRQDLQDFAKVAADLGLARE